MVVRKEACIAFFGGINIYKEKEKPILSNYEILMPCNADLPPNATLDDDRYQTKGNRA